MTSPKPPTSPPSLPPLPPPAAAALGPTPQARLAAWVELRDQLAALNAQLETLRLLARLQQRR